MCHKGERSEINLSIGWLWDSGTTVRLSDEVGGFQAEVTVAAIIDIIPWLEEAIAHFYPDAAYAASLSSEIKERAEQRLFLPPLVGAYRLSLPALRSAECDARSRRTNGVYLPSLRQPRTGATANIQ